MRKFADGKICFPEYEAWTKFEIIFGLEIGEITCDEEI